MGCARVTIILISLLLAGCIAQRTPYHNAVDVEGPQSTLVDKSIVQAVRWCARATEKPVDLDLLEGWSISWCEDRACSYAHPASRTIQVKRGAAWWDKMMHEVTHACLSELGYPWDADWQHDFMAQHAICYGSPNCGG
jgi:hypothetical protein